MYKVEIAFVDKRNAQVGFEFGYGLMILAVIPRT
jgi:hypothetical protein